MEILLGFKEQVSLGLQPFCSVAACPLEPNLASAVPNREVLRFGGTGSEISIEDPIFFPFPTLWLVLDCFPKSRWPVP